MVAKLLLTLSNLFDLAPLHNCEFSLTRSHFRVYGLVRKHYQCQIKFQAVWFDLVPYMDPPMRARALVGPYTELKK